MFRTGTPLARKRSRSVRLGYEALESRAMMATDFAAIAGTVFNDLDSNGSLNGIEAGINGVTVTLTGTDGNGPVNRSTVTSGGGLYRFDNLLAGNYQVAQQPPPPSGFLPNPGGSPSAVAINSTQAQGVQGTVVDAFNGVSDSTTASNPGTNPNSSVIADGAVIGPVGQQFRSLFAEVVTANGTAALQSNLPAIPGVLSIDPSNNSRGHYIVTWDGDNNASNLNPIGLRTGGQGVDLTDAGASTALQLIMGIDKGGQTITIRVYTDANNWSEATNVPIPNTGGAPTGEILLRYATSFSQGIGASGPANFANVGAVSIEHTASTDAADGAIDLFAALRPTVITRNFANIAATPEIHIEKATNGQDADTGTGPMVAVGSTVTFSFVVTNTGGVPLTNIVVTDDNGTPGTPGDNFNPAPVLSGAFNVGDVDTDNALDLTESWQYQATRTATAGQYTNIATVTGQDAQQTTVTDTDPSSHFGMVPQINLVKSVNGVDANSPGSGPTVEVGSTVNFTYVVTNTGNVPLTNIQVQDDNGTPGNAADNFFATYNGGDLDGDNALDLTETWTFSAARTAVAGAYQNTAQATGRDPTQQVLSDSDPANYQGSALRRLSKRRFLASAGTANVENLGNSPVIPPPSLSVETLLNRRRRS